jgi:hypothetical protein
MPTARLPLSLGVKLINRAFDPRKRRSDLAPIDLLDLVFDRHCGKDLRLRDMHFDCGNDAEPFHPRFGRSFPVLLASAFSPWMTRAAWRKALIAAEATDDLEAEDALLTRWEREVVAPFAHRYRLDQRSLF